jgi:hypothetical protein
VTLQGNAKLGELTAAWEAALRDAQQQLHREARRRDRAKEMVKRLRSERDALRAKCEQLAPQLASVRYALHVQCTAMTAACIVYAFMNRHCAHRSCKLLHCSVHAVVAQGDPPVSTVAAVAHVLM